jgi:iron complex transport system ATP-binding protein
VASSEVGYSVKDAELVAGASIEVNRGELVAVIGPNGAGKSTLLRLLGADLSPTSGVVTCGTEHMKELGPLELSSLRAFLPQTGRPDIPFSVWAVVAMGRYPHRRRPDNSAEKDRQAVTDALAATDTSHLASRVFATLSGGERTRVSLARVLAQDTPLLLLDEPTTALDLGHQEQMMRVIRGLADGGRGVATVLHDLNAASRYADRVALMAAGRILAEGPPADVYDASLLSDVYQEPLRVIPHPFQRGLLVLPG